MKNKFMKMFATFSLVSIMALGGCKKEKAKTDDEIKSEKVYDSLKMLQPLDIEGNPVYSDIELPSVSQGVDITWASDNTTNAAVAATPSLSADKVNNIYKVAITRPAIGQAAAYAKFTASYKVGEIDGTVDYKIKIPAKIQSVVKTIADVRSSSVPNDTLYFKLENLTVTASFADGFFGLDNKGNSIYIYCPNGGNKDANSVCKGVKSPDVVTVEGTKTIYSGLLEVQTNKAGGDLTVTKVTGGTVNTKASVVKTIEEVSNLPGVTGTTPNHANFGVGYTVTGKFEKIKDGNNTNYFITTGDVWGGATVSAGGARGTEAKTGKQVMLYYKDLWLSAETTAAKVEAFDNQYVGKQVTAKIFTYTYYNNQTYGMATWGVLFDTTSGQSPISLAS